MRVRIRQLPCACLLLGATCLLVVPAAQPQSADSRRPSFHTEISGGALLALGSTTRSIDSGGAVLSALVFDGRRGWSYPIRSYVLFSNLSGSVLQQSNQANGVTNLFGFAFDPTITPLRRGRWSMFASAGGGISWKEVQLWQAGSSCDQDYYCPSSASESTFQPMVDGGAGAAIRVHLHGAVQIFAEARFVEFFTPKGQFPGYGAAGTRTLLPSLGFRF